MYENTGSSDRMSIDKTHFFDRIRPIVTSLWTVSETFRERLLGQESNTELLRRVRWAVFYGSLKSAAERFRSFALNPLEASRWVLLGHFSRWSRACRKSVGPSLDFVSGDKNAGTMRSARTPSSRTCIWNSVLGYCVQRGLS